MVRRFSLTNADNTTWDFTDPAEKVFARNPAGLGLQRTASLLRLGNKQKVVDEQYEFINKTFDVLFYGDTLEEIYRDYNNFINFITVGDISLIYEIPSQNTSYRISVLISELTKTEVKDNGYMSCGLTLVPLSFWEDNIPNRIVADNSSSQLDGKKYRLQRKNGQGYFYAQVEKLDNIEIDIIGNMEVPFSVTIDGFTIDPLYELYSNPSQPATGKCEFTGSYNYVFVNSDEANEEIQLKDSSDNVIAHPYNYQVLSPVLENQQLTFLTLKKGYNQLKFFLGNIFDGTVTIEWRNRYVSV